MGETDSQFLLERRSAIAEFFGRRARQRECETYDVVGCELAAYEHANALDPAECRIQEDRFVAAVLRTFRRANVR